MDDMDIKPTATIEKQLILSFSLPGVDWESRTQRAQQTQLDRDQRPAPGADGERWRLKVSTDNVRETAARLRAVVDELLRFAEAEHL
jgi:hypothetical protein